MKKAFTKREIHQVFKDHDINDTGALNGDYLLKALLSLQLPVENSDIPDLFECVGREKDGIVDLEEFTDIVLELKGGSTSLPSNKDIDHVVDDDDCEDEDEDEPTSDVAFEILADPAINGITLESLLKVCETLEEFWTKQQIMEMMNEADLNHDGIIDPTEFRIVCKKAGL